MAAPRRGRKIVALGDSLTAGLGLLEQQAYPALLQRKIDADGYQFDVVNAGVPATRRPAACVVSTGRSKATCGC